MQGTQSAPTADEAQSIAEIESLFDVNYYRTRYADISANPQIDPLRHFCSIGWRQGRDPTNWFSTARYLASHPDVASSGINPFIHYVLVRRDAHRQLAHKPNGPAEPIEHTIDEAMVDRDAILRVAGWVVSFAPLQEISVSFGGQKIGLAEYGLRRDDVGAVYADYPESDRCGFSFIQQLDVELADPLVTIDIAVLGGVKRQMTIVPELAPTIRLQKPPDKVIRYNIDTLSLSGDGTLVVEGWAISGNGITAITIEFDGNELGAAVTGLPRPDVGNAHPRIPSARWGGFRISRHLANCSEGEHTIVLNFANDVKRRVITLPVVARNQPQPGNGIKCHVDSPRISAGNTIDPVYGDLSLSGWAVAPSGISHIEVFLAGQSKGMAYYGSRRLDIKAAFPALPGSALSGFGMSVPRRWNVGAQNVRVVIHDKGGNTHEEEFCFESRPPDDGEAQQLRRKVKQVESDMQLAICDALRCRVDFILLLRLRNGGIQEARRALRTVESLRNQTYRTWRLLIICPDKINESVIGAVADRRVSTAPTIDFNLDGHDTLVALLRAGDVLGTDALQETAVEAALHREATILYCDERRYDYATRAVGAFYKPDWSPDLLLSTNYLGRLWFARAPALRDIQFTVAGLKAGEYDLLLRLTDIERPVHHIAKLLCVSETRHSDSARQERQALRGALRRRGITGSVREGCLPYHYRVKRVVQTTAMVSIIIPTIAAKGLIKQAITSIRERTTYRNFEIICIDGLPRQHDLKQWLRKNSDQIVPAPRKFNWSKCNNLGAARAHGDFFVFLNDDTEVTDPDWLHALLEHAERPEIGVVGPMLVYPDGKVQHAGLVMQPGDKHIFRFAESSDTGAFGLIQTQRNMIALTGACMMVSRSVFETLGGFDEAHTVINNDMDFCLRCWQRGLRIVYTPHTRLIHYEETSRAELRDDYDVKRFDRTWRRLIALGDPYSNPNIAQDNDGYRVETEPTQVLHVGHPFIAARKVERILVVKLDHIGDFITAIPSIDRLRERFVGAEITALVGKSSGALARATASIDRVLEFAFFRPRSGDGPYPLTEQKLADLRAVLAPYDFDIAVDLRQQMDTRQILKYTGAKWLAGYDTCGSASWLDISLELVIDTRQEPKRAHVSNALMQIVETVAIACQSNRTVLPSSTRDEARRRFVQLPAVASFVDVSFESPLVCMHPGVGSATRQWPAEHFATLANLLIDGEGAKVILIGSPNERDIARRIAQDVDAKASIFPLVGETHVSDLPDILLSCDLFIGNNSGPHHIAAGLGVPTVGVHSGVVDATEWGPLGSHAVAIRRDMNCSPCYLERVSDCHRGHACMRGLLPRDVYRICQRLLALRAAFKS